MKSICKAAVAMALIILARMVLSFGFSEQLGAVFCNTACTALFFHAVAGSRGGHRAA